MPVLEPRRGGGGDDAGHVAVFFGYDGYSGGWPTDPTASINLAQLVVTGALACIVGSLILFHLRMPFDRTAPRTHRRRRRVFRAALIITFIFFVLVSVAAALTAANSAAFSGYVPVQFGVAMTAFNLAGAALAITVFGSFVAAHRRSRLLRGANRVLVALLCASAVGEIAADIAGVATEYAVASELPLLACDLSFNGLIALGAVVFLAFGGLAGLENKRISSFCAGFALLAYAALWIAADAVTLTTVNDSQADGSYGDASPSTVDAEYPLAAPIATNFLLAVVLWCEFVMLSGYVPDEDERWERVRW